MAMAVIGIIGIAGMIGQVAVSGKDSAQQSDALRQSVQDMITQINSFTENYNNLLSATDTDIAQLDQKIENDVQLITQLSAKISDQKSVHSATYRTIQIAGITMIFFIAFIFILKIFGFYEVVNDIILYPFKKLFGKT